MKLSFSAFGLSFAAGFDANEARAAGIERAARKTVAAELRALEIEARAAVIRSETEKRAAEIAARVAQIKADMARPTN